MSSDLINGNILLNLDSEQEGIFIAGCAGGRDTRISISVTPLKITGKNPDFFTIEVNGLQGGHSGVDIHRQRANAIKILVRCLMALDKTYPVRLVTIHGGSAHNAIPRFAKAEIAGTPDKVDEFQKIVKTIEKTVRREFKAVESSINIIIKGPRKRPEGGHTFISHPETQKIIQLLLALPHGVVAMSQTIENKVETSCNLAVVNHKKDIVEIVASQRSSVMSRLEDITDTIKATACLAGATVADENSYPAWEPQPNSPILDRCKTVYRQLFKTEAVVDVIHAGLECAVIGATYPQMDMISFGPTIEGAHSPDEKLFVPSVDRIWTFLTALLESLAKENV
jgi:dipeptidase D